MSVYVIDPLQDPRWRDLLRRHPGSSVFHSPGWLSALRRTYGYEPVVFTTSPPGEALSNGWAFCRIRSWLTGRRLVSLPFSDHCEPLEDGAQTRQEIRDYLTNELRRENWNYIESRPLRCRLPLHFQESETFFLHLLDLRPTAEQLFSRFHKSSIQRKIRRAEREGLSYETGNNPLLLRKFYHLQLLTRKRHQLPPQPLDWFQNLIYSMGEQLTIRVVSKDGKPAAAVLSLSCGDKVVYKYGGSDAQDNPLGGMALLFWKMIQEAKRDGALELDLGRSDVENAGLITFKDRWGAARLPMNYWRIPSGAARPLGKGGWKPRMAGHIFAHLPDGVLPIVGKALYRHMG